MRYELEVKMNITWRDFSQDASLEEQAHSADTHQEKIWKIHNNERVGAYIASRQMQLLIDASHSEKRLLNKPTPYPRAHLAYGTQSVGSRPETTATISPGSLFN